MKLPEAKTYLPGPGKCIYCPPDKSITDDLTREHIIARTLGGQLILHQASCPNCANQINQAIETPILTQFWLNVRAHLGLPTSHPRSTLRIGRLKDNGDALPTDLSNADFQLDEIPLNEHSVWFFGIRFAPPGIFANKPLVETFQIEGVGVYMGSKPSPLASKGEKTVEFTTFSPDILCRFIAKIAHGAAVAELGLESFDPLLPDIIMGRSPYISHLVGSSPRRGRKRTALHEITLKLQQGLLVANVQLFAKFGLRPYQAVVGRPSAHLSRWHMSSPLVASMAWQ